MIIKKFKNGNINIRMEASDDFYYERNWDKLYNNEMSDLYFNRINDYEYLIDWNTGMVYDMTNLLGYLALEGDILTALFTYIENNKGSIKLYPMSNKEGKDILQDLENGF